MAEPLSRTTLHPFSGMDVPWLVESRATSRRDHPFLHPSLLPRAACSTRRGRRRRTRPVPFRDSGLRLIGKLLDRLANDLEIEQNGVEQNFVRHETRVRLAGKEAPNFFYPVRTQPYGLRDAPTNYMPAARWKTPD